MSVFVDSLKRLYLAQRVTLVKLDEFLLEGKITQEEYDYIIE